jgi:NAD(P)-dependent dehydrogenase (short-subunit alcohol dehydrogenase family)
MDIKGKVVIITGASEGIGLEAARRFAGEGAFTVIAARSLDKLENLAKEIRAGGNEVLVVPTDMTKPLAVRNLVDKAFAWKGRIDILINNAGQAAAGAVAEINPEYFRQILDLNVFGPVYAIQAAVPLMKKTGGGLIMNISSMVSKMKIPGLGTYAATKSALNMLSDTARVELADANIRVITVYPRGTETDFGKHSLGDQGLRQGQRASVPAYQRDSADYVALKILDAARTEVAEQFMTGDGKP